MKDILEEIIAHKRKEIEEFKAVVSERELHELIERKLNNDDKVASMREALMKSDTGIIAEFKRKSPSKGWINEQGRADVIPLAYQNNGASAVSILTDTLYFGGNDDYILTAIDSGVTIPILYKNFVVDEYQLFQARNCGASAVLLIAADLKIDECKTLMQTAHEIGLEVLLEMHGEDELDYAELEADMYGINNRNLGTFITDVQKSFDMCSRLPDGVCKVSESGISDAETIRLLRKSGYNGFLIGETFMKESNQGEALSNFIKDIKQGIGC